MKNRTILSNAALIITLLLAACGGGPANNQADELAKLKEERAALDTKIAALEKEVNAANPPAQRVRTVGVTEVQSGPFRHYIDMQGKVDADQSVAATAKMPGTLTRVLVNNGDQVRKGQLLAVLDDDLMVRGLSELEVQLRTAEDLYQRQKGLWDQKIGTEVQYIQAKTQKEALEQRIASTRAQIGQARIYAPISGTVDYVVLKVGQAISPGMPLCNILNLSNLKIKGEVPEAYAAKVHKGDPVVLSFPDLDKEVTSRVTYVSGSINPTNRTFTVECALPPGKDWRANMIAVMKIVDYQAANAVTVPVNVIQSDATGDFVLVAEKAGDKQATVKKVAVKQGANYNGRVEILSGLKKGDQIITTGFQDVNAGEVVAI